MYLILSRVNKETVLGSSRPSFFTGVEKQELEITCNPVTVDFHCLLSFLMDCLSEFLPTKLSLNTITKSIHFAIQWEWQMFLFMYSKAE